MGYQAADFLAAIFGDGPTLTAAVAVSPPVPVAMKPPAIPFGADGWPAEAVEPGEPCPKCRGLLWWEDLEGGRHCLDCERERFERAQELVGLAGRLREASGLSPGEPKRPPLGNCGAAGAAG